MIAIILHLYYKCKEGFDVAEITKYSTDGGLVDKDSAPGNAEVTFTNGTPIVSKYEDDTDDDKFFDDFFFDE